MKSGRIFWGSLLIPVAVWLLAPFVSAYPGWIYSLVYDECSPKNDTKKPDSPASSASQAEYPCDSMISRRGQSGDIYGSVGSLFTGLALFGVAYTLLTDLSYRRRERKPIIVCAFEDKEEVFLKNSAPNDKLKTAAIAGKLVVRALNNAALNIKIDARLLVGENWFNLSSLDIDMPMRDGDDVKVDISHVLNEHVMLAFVHAFPNVPKFIFEFRAKYQNLESAQFETSVRYRLSLRYANQASKILWFGADDPNNAEAWIDPTPVTLAPSLEPGTWRFVGGTL